MRCFAYDRKNFASRFGAGSDENIINAMQMIMGPFCFRILTIMVNKTLINYNKTKYIFKQYSEVRAVISKTRTNCENNFIPNILIIKLTSPILKFKITFGP